MSQALLGGSMQEQGMGQESKKAEERYLNKCARGIGPEMILLKAKICVHHPPSATCSRFLTNAS